MVFLQGQWRQLDRRQAQETTFFCAVVLVEWEQLMSTRWVIIAARHWHPHCAKINCQKRWKKVWRSSPSNADLRGASGVVHLTSEQHPPRAIHYQGSAVQRHLPSHGASFLHPPPSLRRCRRRAHEHGRQRGERHGSGNDVFDHFSGYYQDTSTAVLLKFPLPGAVTCAWLLGPWGRRAAVQREMRAYI
jgi:hypothetical protein